MKSSTELHQLIQSMNSSEKRYFKIYSSRHTIGEKNNYIRLFDAIEHQEIYAEQEIKNKFTNETFIKHLPSEKHYLYDQVLGSLNAFHKERTFLTRHANILVSIEILYNRGLFNQCKKLITKAKKEAYRLEKFSVLLLILRWETLIHIKNEDDKNLNKNIAEELRVLEVMRVQYTLMQIAFNVQIQIDKSTITARFIRASEKKLKKNLPASENVNSFWAKYYYHSTNGLIASVEKKHMLRYHSYKEIKRLMDSSPQFIIDLPGIYHLNSNNLVSTMFLLKKYAEAEILIRHQRSFLHNYKISSPALSKMIFLHSYENELFLLYKTHRFEKGAVLAREIEGEVKKIAVNFSPVLFDLLFLMAVTELMVKNYKGTAKWLNKILNAERHSGFRTELKVNTRLLYLILLYESNDLLFDNRLDSTKRFLSHEPQFKAQSMIVDAIRLLADDVHTKKNKESLRKYINGIRREFKRSGEEWLYKQFDFAGWIEGEFKKNSGNH